MYDPVELGRAMMAEVGNIKDDAEFNRWARLAPILIANHPRTLQELPKDDTQEIKRALSMLLKKGVVTRKN